MGTPYIAELKLVSFNFAPKGWALCNGQLMAINQNQALFACVGTTYGGNGQTTFGLPNLQGRTPVSTGAGFYIGQVGGEENHTLNVGEVPTHNHPVSGLSSNATADLATNNFLATTTGTLSIYNAVANVASLNVNTVTSVGGSQPHNNQQPYLVMNWIIALTGIFPTQN